MNAFQISHVRSVVVKAVCVFVFLFMSACGDESEEQKAKLSGDPEDHFQFEFDPCAVVSSGEVGEALGQAVEEGRVLNVARRDDRIVGGICTYRARYNPQAQVTLSRNAFAGLDIKMSFEQGLKNPRVEKFKIAKREAYAFQSPGGFIELTVLMDDALLRVNITGQSVSDQLEATQELARIAVRRLEDGEAIERVAGLEALIGTWKVTGDKRVAEDGPGLITVLDGGHWKLDRVQSVEGNLSIDGKSWIMQGEKDEYSGNYEWEGSDSFYARGTFAMRFDRIMCGKAPWLVDPELAQQLSKPSSSLFKKSTIDSNFSGLWQGIGQFEGEHTVILWYVAPKGDATMLFVRHLEGRLEARGGQLDYEPNLKQRENGTYRVLGPGEIKIVTPLRNEVWKRKGPTSVAQPLLGPCDE